MEMGPGLFASSGNMLCLSRTADFEHEVADANQQTLIFFPWGGQELWDGQGCRLYLFWRVSGQYPLRTKSPLLIFA